VRLDLPFAPQTLKEKILNWAVPILLLINTIALTISFTSPLFLKVSPATAFTPPLKEICYQAFNSVLKRQADKRLIKEEITTYLEQDNYAFFDFKENTKVKSVIARENSCTVITKDIVGLRFFKLKVFENSSSPFLFKVKNMEEITLSETF